MTSEPGGRLSVAATKAQVVRIARELRRRGLAIGTSGNVASRVADGRIAITPANMDADDMTPDDIVILDPDGAPSEGRRRPSSELRIHVGILAATTFAISRRPIPAVHYVLATVVEPGRDTIRVAPYATFGTEELARNVVATLGADHAVLLASHGAIAVGPSLDVALARAERTEELAMLAWHAATLGDATLLDAAELDRVRDQMARFPLQTPDQRQ
jgi:L-fuculose-phosphate aldolase